MKKKKCGRMLLSKYICFSIRAGFEFVLVLDMKLAFSTCQREKEML